MQVALEYGQVWGFFEYTQGNITARLNFLTQSCCMRPNLQVLTWFQCCELGAEELFIRFMLNGSPENLLCDFIVSQWALI
jgi:hypothetical protein